MQMIVIPHFFEEEASTNNPIIIIEFIFKFNFTLISTTT